MSLFTLSLTYIIGGLMIGHTWLAYLIMGAGVAMAVLDAVRSQ